MEKQKEEFTRYEIARILGARALQIAMNAPLLIKLSKDDLEKIRYDALKIAEIEFESGVLPISVKRPMPRRKDEKLRRIKERTSEQKIDDKEHEEEDDIMKEGEIMELANPDDEMEEDRGNEEAGED